MLMMNLSSKCGALVIRKKHAEEKIIDYFRDNYERDAHLTLTLYLTRAPCGLPGVKDGGCTSKLVQLTKDYRNLTLNIKVMGGYQLNQQGLRSLITNNEIPVDAFRNEDWTDLRRILRLPETVTVERLVTGAAESRIRRTDNKLVAIANGTYRNCRPIA